MYVMYSERNYTIYKELPNSTSIYTMYETSRRFTKFKENCKGQNIYTL